MQRIASRQVSAVLVARRWSSTGGKKLLFNRASQAGSSRFKKPADQPKPQASNSLDAERTKSAQKGAQRNTQRGARRSDEKTKVQGAIKPQASKSQASKPQSPKSQSPIKTQRPVKAQGPKSESPKSSSAKSSSAKGEMPKERTERPKSPAKKPKAEKEKIKQNIAIPKFITVANLAHLLKMRLPAFQSHMKAQGFDTAEHDHILESETAALIVEELGYNPVVSDIQGEDLYPETAPTTANDPLRPPIVTIMGHVDHGKTTILDYLRKSSVAAGEHGGITQHIGAFSVHMPSGKEICFLDTPGHAAFLNMRQRGANVTDIVILVVAADDSVMPQTKEAIKHAKNASVPVIVAINKCDRPDADVDRVIADLAANEVDVEPYGGDTQVIPVSGLKGTNIDQLEEAILTLSEILEMRAPANAKVEGWVIESETKKGLGNVATVLVKRGTLKPGAFVVAGKKWCKVRSLINDQGKQVKKAGPGTPVVVLGWKDLPEAGDQVLEAKNEAHVKKVITFRQQQDAQLEELKNIEVMNEKRKAVHEEQERKAEKQERARLGLDEPDASELAELEDAAEPAKNMVKFIVKADVSGSAEAVSDSIQGLGNDEVEASVLYSGVGAITETDITRAEAAGAAILSFNLKTPKDSAVLAGRRKVEIVEHTIIYRLLEDVTNRLTSELKPEIKHRVLAEAEIKDVFEITLKKPSKKKMLVAGCRVSNGLLQRKSPCKVLRNKEQVYIGTFTSMKHHKEEVAEAKKDSECGLAFEGWTDFQSGDVVQTYEELIVPRHL